MPTDAAMTEAEARIRAKSITFGCCEDEVSDKILERAVATALLAAEQQGYRRGVADAAKVCDERKEARKGMTDSAYVSGMEAGGCAVEIRERLGGEAT